MIHFKTDSYPMVEIKRTCDKEVGSPKRGWHVCNRIATAEKESKACPGLFLHYCAKHA